MSQPTPDNQVFDAPVVNIQTRDVFGSRYESMKLQGNRPNPVGEFSYLFTKFIVPPARVGCILADGVLWVSAAAFSMSLAPALWYTLLWAGIPKLLLAAALFLFCLAIGSVLHYANTVTQNLGRVLGYRLTLIVLGALLALF